MREWIKAALIRAIKTFAQTCVAMIPVGVSIDQVSWIQVLGTAVLAFVVSILTSIAGLPEVKANETIQLMQEGILPLRDNNEDEEDPS